MIGEFLLQITLLHTIIVGVVFVSLLIVTAYKKPKWYYTTKGLMIAFIGILAFYKWGWEAAEQHHEIAIAQHTKFSDGFMVLLYLLVLLDMVWLRYVQKHMLQEEHAEE